VTYRLPSKSGPHSPRIKDLFGSISVFRNNAGVSFNGLGDASADVLELEMWNRIIAINLTGTYLCRKYALPLLLAGKRGGT
jgi:NAD(P)-dependent dehydrogenase (short-subunit alcohol dehydrogenase family)